MKTRKDELQDLFLAVKNIYWVVAETYQPLYLLQQSLLKM